jgi:hypothetical protein
VFDDLEKARQYDSPATTTIKREITYRYDPVGRRVALDHYGQPTTAAGFADDSEFYGELYGYDGQNMYVVERVPNAFMPVPPERKWFTQDAIDRLLALTIADPAAMADPAQRPTAGPQAVSYDYHTDEQDSVRVVSNASGAVVNEHD